MFQTFEDLESVKDKQADVEAIRKVLDGEKPKESAVEQCLLLHS
jgi:hypothetical protein